MPFGLKNVLIDCPACSKASIEKNDDVVTLYFHYCNMKDMGQQANQSYRNALI